MNKTIIQMLIDSDSEYVSGQNISDKLGITRAAVWKRISKLKELGFEIESVTKKGYKLLSYPDILNKELIEIGMKSDFIGHSVEVLESVDSTNDYAKKKAKELVDGSVIISLEQVKGKGRRGRSFHSGKGDGIYLSIILKPGFEPTKAPFITSIAGAALVNTFNKFNIQTKVKWPNDVLINGKKVAGILTEMSADMEFIEYIVLGVGINVSGLEFPNELKNIATSLKLEGYDVKKLSIIWQFIYEFELLYNLYLNENTSEVVNILRNNSSVIGKQINVHYMNEIESAIAVDINNQGALIIKTQEGEVKELSSGEISIR
ncbi:biotin--[acetyl-CoA-carboxylase] ligase [Acetoanaerobium noterae]|jgi:BirA family biotin operon repressor/biotin-[acetyl-CoA-carboxylase] ligase|uniref:biotin--[acetyl-CoA-carboxylase] ligase n=1 Tax=Acetoanaerobium noterae TaxID=745369 RepID=UPI003241E2B9